jgi:phage replication-related protein YjqB (UPF0714/DUF867 family)
VHAFPFFSSLLSAPCRNATPAFSAIVSRQMKPDRYAGFAELSVHEREGIEYQIRSHRRNSTLAIIAPHGGKIEPGTSEIGEAIAGERFTFYAFEGIKRGRNHDLHITSTRFDEPECIALLQQVGAVAAIHGLSDISAEYVCVGGAHDALKKVVVTALRDAGFDGREDDDPAHSGADSRNICNRFSPGIQLEISRALRDRLQEGTEDLEEFAATLRNALIAFQSEGSAGAG